MNTTFVTKNILLNIYGYTIHDQPSLTLAFPAYVLPLGCACQCASFPDFQIYVQGSLEDGLSEHCFSEFGFISEDQE